MRRTLLFCGTCLAIGLLACGGKKAAKDPSSDDAPPVTSDDTPKWEGATAEDKAPPPTPTAKVSTAPNEKAQHRSDQYDKEGTDPTLKRAARNVKTNCGQAKDDNGKAIGPWGKLTISLMLGANGHMKSVTVPSPWQGKPVGTCIERSFGNLQFPPWQGSDTSVDWDVELIEPGKEAPPSH